MENKPNLPKETLPIAVAAGSKFLIEGMGAGMIGAAAVASPLLVGALLAAGAFCVGKIFTSDEEGENGDKRVLETLNRTSLNVEIGDDGKVSATTASTSVQIPADQPVVVERHSGTTVVHIQTLNINLNANRIDQLNMNPNEVFNNIHEQIQEAIKKYS